MMTRLIVGEKIEHQWQDTMTKEVYHIIYERFCVLDEKWFLELDSDKAKKLKLERDRLHKLLSESKLDE